MSGALSGVRVLDLTRVLAGPYCTMMLADLGAEVIKIEVPHGGDDTRSYPPFKNGSSMYFAYANRNKKGVTLNLKSPEGREIFLKMAEKSDMVVENFRPGVMDKLGVGYDVLKKINPRIIYGALSGFGSWGRNSALPGYDIIAQAVGGLMSITGTRESGPLRSGNAIGDVLGGLNLTVGLLAALNARNVTGVGQRVDVALVDSVVASLEAAPQNYFGSGEIPGRVGNEYAATYPYDAYTASDRLVIIGAANQKLFKNLVDLMGKPELLTDPRFSTLDERNKRENRDALREIMNEWASHYKGTELVEKVLARGVPASLILDLKEVAEDAHIAHDREMFVNLDHPVIGKMRVTGSPVKLSATPARISRRAPASLGEDNESVYQEILGLSRDEVKKLKEKGVL